MPVNQVLIDNRVVVNVIVNVIPSFMLRDLGKNSKDLVYTDITISYFTGDVSKSKEVLLVALTIKSKTLMSAFFIVNFFELLIHYWNIIGSIQIGLFHLLSIIDSFFGMEANSNI